MEFFPTPVCVIHSPARLAVRLLKHHIGGMHNAFPRASIWGLIGLTSFGVAYDSGLFGVPDGHDHSAVLSVAASTGSIASVNSIIAYTPNTITGDDIAMPWPRGPGKIVC